MNNRGVSLVLFTALSLQLLCSCTRGHIVTIEDLEHFYDLETKLVNAFQTYIQEQTFLLHKAKERLEEYRRIRTVTSDVGDYVGNPLNTHALLRRLVSDWPLTLALLRDTEPFIEEGSLPTVDEYKATVHSITRLQQVYNFSIADLVIGSPFQNTEPSSTLTAGDCFSIAVHLYESKHYPMAVDWFKEALRQAGKTGHSGQRLPPSEQLLEYLALATCFKGDHAESRNLFLQLFSTYPSFHPSQDLINHHLMVMNGDCVELGRSLKPKIDNSILGLPASEVDKMRVKFEQLCRIETQPKTLHCHLAHYNKPHLHLRPVKLEELHLDPPVLMFHDTILSGEIDHFAKNIYQHMTRKWDGGLMAGWDGRLQEVSEVGGRVVKRVMELTGMLPHPSELDVFISKEVGNEDIIDHLDLPPDKKRRFFGDRVATLMFYLQEPNEGGDLVFPQLNISVTPPRGAAVLWYNQHPSGHSDFRTVFGSCPVLNGHKWVGVTSLLTPGPQCSADKKLKWKNTYL